MRLNTMLPHFKSKKGFTLVELSIVIVIIGLIAAGVTAGSALVNQSKLRSVASEINQYKTAYLSFYLKYNSVPGDMTNAFSYWGTAAGCTNASASGAGCNGNGNRKVGLAVTTTYLHFEQEKAEDYRAWQFMALDGLIPGAYNGSGGQVWNIGVNVPVSAYGKNVGYRFNYVEQVCRWNSANMCGITVLLKKPGNYLLLGSLSSALTRLQGPVLKTADALSYDTKVDDGLPHSGLVIGYTGEPVSGAVTNHCTAEFGGTNAYILTNNTLACAMMVLMDK